MFAPGTIRANVKAAENSRSVSQQRSSVSSSCARTDTPPPKLVRPIFENVTKIAIKRAPDSGGAGVAPAAGDPIEFSSNRGFLIFPNRPNKYTFGIVGASSFGPAGYSEYLSNGHIALAIICYMISSHWEIVGVVIR